MARGPVERAGGAAAEAPNLRRRPAHVVLRALAALFDGLVLFGGISFFMGSFAWDAFAPACGVRYGTGHLIAATLFVLIPAFAYLTVTTAQLGGTLGHRAVGLRIVSAEGGKPTGRNAALRAGIALVPLQLVSMALFGTITVGVPGARVLFFALVGLAALSIPILICTPALRSDGRGPQDLIAGTRVELAYRPRMPSRKRPRSTSSSAHTS